MNYVLQTDTGYYNLSPLGFRRTAEDFLAAYEAFKPSKFSIVPTFLCCRAIELALKSIHLELHTQLEVKHAYSHNLKRAYEDLPSDRKVLTPAETQVLTQADRLYTKKHFEYLQPGDAATAYMDFPPAAQLADIAGKLISVCSE